MRTNPELPLTPAPGLLLVLSAPSGAGKTTLARRLEKEFPRAQFSISYTTREPRGVERNGVDYHFVGPKTFLQMVNRGDFIEWAEVHDNYYGTSRGIVDTAFETRGIAVFDIDVKGGLAIKSKFPDAVLVFVLPPSMEELERRLRGRGTDKDETIHRRLLAARTEIEKGLERYDYLIINDALDRAYEELKSVVIAEQARRGRVDLSGLQLQRAEIAEDSDR
ncbi:MAG: guanylate kinase [Myxococcaceae bacterium]|jgi:guanylate kinase|nr:guanylate kinase [Myxococcaceae bacterium]MCA3015638.1 guanylate kinase [Myxococcaceae bacterium]